MKRSALLSSAVIALSLLAGACGERADGPASNAAAGEARRVIEVRMVTDEKGNYFDPAEITARPGDVLRFRLVTGVHNVSFSAVGERGQGRAPAAQQPARFHRADAGRARAARSRGVRLPLRPAPALRDGGQAHRAVARGADPEKKI